MMGIYLSWTDFKNEISSRSIIPQWQLDRSGFYSICGNDGYIKFLCKLDSDDTGNADLIDFENNYKDDWNKQLEFHDNGGMQQFVSSPRPPGMTTYYTSNGDNLGVGDGNELKFHLLATDAQKQVDLVFNEDVYLKDGFINTENAPFGATFELEVVHPIAGVVGSFCRAVQIYQSGLTNFDSEDKAHLPAGMMLRAIVNNASTGAEFRLIGVIEMFRTTTV